MQQHTLEENGEAPLRDILGPLAKPPSLSRQPEVSYRSRLKRALKLGQQAPDVPWLLAKLPAFPLDTAGELSKC